MSITESSEVVQFDENGQIRPLFPWRRLFVSLVVVLVGILSFGLGRLSAPQGGGGVKIEYDQSLMNITLHFNRRLSIWQQRGGHSPVKA